MANFQLSNSASQVNSVICCYYSAMTGYYIGATGTNSTTFFCILAPNRNPALNIHNGYVTWMHSNVQGFNNSNSDVAFCLYNGRGVKITDNLYSNFCFASGGLVCFGTVSCPKNFVLDSNGNVGIGETPTCFFDVNQKNSVATETRIWNSWTPSRLSQKHHVTTFTLQTNQVMHQVGSNTIKNVGYNPNLQWPGIGGETIQGTIWGYTGTGMVDPAWATAPRQDLRYCIYLSANESLTDKSYSYVRQFGDYGHYFVDSNHFHFRNKNFQDKIYINATDSCAYFGEINYASNVHQFITSGEYLDVRLVNFRKNFDPPLIDKPTNTIFTFRNHNWLAYNAIVNRQLDCGKSHMYFQVTSSGASGQNTERTETIFELVGSSGASQPNKKALVYGDLCAYTGCFDTMCSTNVCVATLRSATDTTNWCSDFISGPNIQLRGCYIPQSGNQKHHTSILSFRVKNRLHQVLPENAQYSPSAPGNIGGWTGAGVTDPLWSTAPLEEISYNIGLNANASLHDKCYHYVQHEGTFSHFFVDANYFHFRSKAGLDKIYLNSHSGNSNFYDGEINLSTNFVSFLSSGNQQDFRFLNYCNQGRSIITFRNRLGGVHSMIENRQLPSGDSFISFKTATTGPISSTDRYRDTLTLSGDKVTINSPRTAFGCDGVGWHWFTSNSGSRLSEPSGLGYGFHTSSLGLIDEHRWTVGTAHVATISSSGIQSCTGTFQRLSGSTGIFDFLSGSNVCIQNANIRNITGAVVCATCINASNTSASWGFISILNGVPIIQGGYNLCESTALRATTLSYNQDFFPTISYAYKIRLRNPVKYPFSFQSTLMPTGITFQTANYIVLPFSCEDYCGLTLESGMIGYPSFFNLTDKNIINYTGPSQSSGTYYCTYPTSAILLNCGGKQTASGWINEKFSIGCYYSNIYITLLNSKGPITTYGDLCCSNHNINLMFNIHGEIL